MTQSPSDAVLVKAALRGDEASAAALYRRHAEALYAACYRVTLNAALANDCTQEAWIKIFRHLERFDVSASFIAWARSIAVRCAIDEVRKASRRAAVSVDAGDEFPEYSLNESARGETDANTLQAKLSACLGLLSGVQRAAFSMRHYEGASYAEIAETLGVAEGTVKTHIHRAALILRKALAPYAEAGYERER
ncbi:MAG: sigma-70 family RNA polymerase sigma factor [bacterium]|nr:sigma-70 family RNA polymerase sigma factor [bacterium]